MKEYITANGKNLMMKVLAGECQVKFTRIVFGDGSIGLSSPRKVSTLVHPVTSIDVERVESEGNGHFFIKARFTNENLKSSFYMREKGVYASDGENEILFSYGNAEDNANLIPLPSEELIEQWSVLDFTVQQDGEGETNIELKSGIYVVKDDYATTQKVGLVKPDGITILVGEDGTIHCNLTADELGLGNVDNTSDADKPISTAQQNALDAKAPINSPDFTGIPTTPTASAGTNTTQIANTAFVQSAVSSHDSSTAAHNDIRNLISGLSTRLNALADSDDTTLDQLSEIVAYIKSNRTLIETITTNKVNVADIVDNLTSAATNKPLSAQQGKVLNDLISALTTTVGNKVDKVSGKGLSTNDYTTTEKNKLGGIASGAEVNVQSDWNVTDTNSDAFIKNKPSIPTNTWRGIQNNLTSDSTTDSLAAKQGKILKAEIDDLKKSVSDGKSSIASAITAMGVSTASDAAFSIMSANIQKIKAALSRTSNVVKALINGKNEVTLTIPKSTAAISDSWSGATYTVNVTHTDGYIDAGTESHTVTLGTKEATTITPSTTTQTAIGSGKRLYFSGALQVKSLGGSAAVGDVLEGVSFSSDVAGREARGTLKNYSNNTKCFVGNAFAIDGSNSKFVAKLIEHISFNKFGLTAVKSTGTAPTVSEYQETCSPQISVATGGYVHVYRSTWSFDTSKFSKIRVYLWGYSNTTSGSTACRGHVGIIYTGAPSSTGNEGNDNLASSTTYQFSTTSTGGQWITVEIPCTNAPPTCNFSISVVHGGVVRIVSAVFM